MAGKGKIHFSSAEIFRPARRFFGMISANSRTLRFARVGSLASLLALSPAFTATAADEKGSVKSPQLEALDRYFDEQVSAIEGQLEREIKTKGDWLAKKDEYRRQLREMLGLDPLPPRTDLKAIPILTGIAERSTAGKPTTCPGGRAKGCGPGFSTAAPASRPPAAIIAAPST